MSAIGNLNDYVKFQMAEGMAKGGGGPAGSAAEIAMGFGMAHQMMGQGAFNMNPAAATATAPSRRCSSGSRRSCPPTSSRPPRSPRLSASPKPMSSPASTPVTLKGKKIGSQYRITKAALDEFLANRRLGDWETKPPV
jgi:hypothetical protein